MKQSTPYYRHEPSGFFQRRSVGARFSTAASCLSERKVILPLFNESGTESIVGFIGRPKSISSRRTEAFISHETNSRVILYRIGHLGFYAPPQTTHANPQFKGLGARHQSTLI